MLVSLGGDIAVAGPAPEGGWRIRVQDVTGSPDEPPEGPYALVAIRDGGLATSSTKARRWQRGGDVLHHILDPRTGLPAEPVWRTVSVAAGTCADANAASTAAVIRGRAALGWLAQARPAVPPGRRDRRGVHRGRLARRHADGREADMSGTTAFWYASRATGVVALLLLTAVLVLGILVNRQGRLPGLPRFAVTSLHRNISLLAVAFIAVHVVTAVLDTYVSIPLVSGVIPFASGYERLWLGLGAISFDLMLAMIITSLLRGRLNRTLWRAIHLLAYLCWPVAFAHSIGSSRDLQHGWLLDLGDRLRADRRGRDHLAAGQRGAAAPARRPGRRSPGPARAPWPAPEARQAHERTSPMTMALNETASERRTRRRADGRPLLPGCPACCPWSPGCPKTCARTWPGTAARPTGAAPAT